MGFDPHVMLGADGEQLQGNERVFSGQRVWRFVRCDLCLLPCWLLLPLSALDEDKYDGDGGDDDDYGDHDGDHDGGHDDDDKDYADVAPAPSSAPAVVTD